MKIVHVCKSRTLYSNLVGYTEYFVRELLRVGIPSQEPPPCRRKGYIHYEEYAINTARAYDV